VRAGFLFFGGRRLQPAPERADGGSSTNDPVTAIPDLSVCLIVRNEAARLPACLESVRSLAAEIIVVDTGSTDGTPEVAREAGARVHAIVWPDDFSAARNASLELATGRWILVLDADETLSPEACAAIRREVVGPADHACSLVQRNRLPDGAGHVCVRIVRLFPRHPRVRFERPIHEQVNTGLEREGIPILDTEIAFEHGGYEDIRAMPAKTLRNRALIEAALARDPEGDPNLRYFHAATFSDAGDHGRAAEEYALCARASAGRRRKLAEAATLKQAESYVLGGRPDLALPLLPASPAGEVHPLACDLRARLASENGRGDEARRWRERLLAHADTAYLPPVALGPMKLRALSALAEDWFAAGRKDAAVRVLRLSLEIAQGRRVYADGELARAYAAAVGSRVGFSR
jgi:hypothetical protein